MKTLILGLTGSIGMGKTFAADSFRRTHIPVFIADDAVHGLLSPMGEAVPLIRRFFPQAVQNDIVDRRVLGDEVFGNTDNLRQLETILHPLVQKQKAKFLARAQQQRQPVVVLEIPLLFETGGEAYCDYVVVVTAPAFVQRSRVMSRVGMTELKYSQILANQIPDSVKRKKADFIIFSGLGKAVTYRSVIKLSRLLRRKARER